MTNEQMNQLINQMTQEQKTEFINKVTSDQYVDFMKEMMDKLNTFMDVSLTIIGIMLAFFAFYQFGFRKKQIEKMKSDARETTLKEVAQKLGKSSIEDFKNDIEKSILESTTMNAQEIDKLNVKLDKIRMLHMTDLGFRFQADLSNVRNQDNPVKKLNNLIMIYRDYMISNVDSFEYFSSFTGDIIAKRYNSQDIFSPTEIEEFNDFKALMESLNRIQENISEQSPAFDSLKKWFDLKMAEKNQI